MNPQLLEKIMKSPRLPTLPAIALQVIEAVQKKDAVIKEIAETITLDPALAGKILKTVNSSFYGQPRAVSSVSRAIIILGLNSVKTLALSFSLVSNLKNSTSQGFDHALLWKRSLYTATAARILAKEAQTKQIEDAFLAGLLQDLGMLAMVQTLGDPYTNLVARAGPDHRNLAKLEWEQYETDHAEIGAALAEQWKLPKVLVEPIRFHEKPNKGSVEFLPLIRCVALGNLVAEFCINHSARPALKQYFELGRSWFDISFNRAEELLAAINKTTDETRKLFELPTGELENPQEILARANEELQNITLEIQSASVELEEQNRRLSEQAVTDPLTGVANRRQFDSFINKKFALAAGGAGPLSILLLDADKFKAFNDTYGHLTGDRVLIELANVLLKSTPDDALVARYGGEEFAVIAPNTDLDDAAKLAQAIRSAIEAATVNSEDGKPLKVTASIGVAAYQQTGAFTNAEQMIIAADRALYAAKAAGRNRVHLWSPSGQPIAAAT